MIRIGTRGSDLALCQANYIADLINRDKTEIIVIKTKGDKIQNISFDKMEGKGFFTKELEEALLNNKIDVAVHSMKDLPTDDVPGLRIAAVPEREDPSDILLIREECYNRNNPLPLFDGAHIGTSSLRRVAQIKRMMNSLDVVPLRGNLPTRIRKLVEKKFDAIIVARAGIKRLNIDLGDLVMSVLPYNSFLPAPSQGALALQIRDDNSELGNLLLKYNDDDTDRVVKAERCFLKHFGGGCHIPLGALASIEKGKIHLTGAITSIDGRTSVRKTVVGIEPERLGEELAGLLKEQGADRLI